MDIDSYSRLGLGLAAVFLSIASVGVATVFLVPEVSTILTIAFAAVILVYLLYRWRMVIPAHDRELRQIEAAIYLTPFLSDSLIVPSRWSLDMPALQRIIGQIQGSGFETIVECGSGVSTVALARAIQQQGRGRIVTFENDLRWHALVMRQLERLGLEDSVRLIHARMEEYDGGHYQTRWYSTPSVREALSDVERIDMLLIDGPHCESEWSRAPALKVFRPWLDAHSQIILDDVSRPEEQHVVRDWSKFEELSVEIDLSTASGQAYLSIHDRLSGTSKDDRSMTGS